MSFIIKATASAFRDLIRFKIAWIIIWPILVSTLLWLIIGWKGWDMAVRAWTLGDTTSGILPLPLFPAKVLIPFGAVLLCIQLLFDIYGKLRLLAGAEVPRPPIPDPKETSRMEL